MYTLKEKICILFGENNVPANKFFQLLNLFGDLEQVLAELSNSKQAQTLLGNNYSKLIDTIKRKSFDNLIDDMDNHGVFAVTWFSTDYPAVLRDIPDPPYVLFCRGNAKLLATDCLAVIGTRKVSSYGRRITRDFTAILSEYFTIVSGLAYGVDSIAHEATLDENGATIAVLGGGLLKIYPAANQGLADRIVENGGLLVSEYGLRTDPLAYHFPQRNRIVSGLSKGVLVCQAPAKSGTLSTVDLALDQGKDVFVVPGEIYDAGFSGSNRLIKTVQAACVTTPRDIVDYYDMDSKDVVKQSYQMSIEEQAVVNVLSRGPLTFDELIACTGISPADLNYVLANLEIRSIIVRLPGNLYRLYGGIE